MKILLYFGHPAQYFFLRGAIAALKDRGVTCDLTIKSKDVLERLLREDNADFINILPEGRRSGKFGVITGLIKRDFRLLKFVRNKNYDLFIGSDPSLAHVGFLKGIPVITVLEDDIHIVKKLAGITFPFTSTILTPAECKTGRFEKKTIHYKGYMKLAYLHPILFKREASHLKKPYFLIRASGLDAYHDAGIAGFNVSMIQRVIRMLQAKGSVYISSEGNLDESLKTFKLRINPSQMHQVLANAEMLISDSQSMSMEAAMLGIPSVRFSDFAGRISVLESLEHNYGLTYGIPASKPEKLLEKIEELLSLHDLSSEFANRRRKMLADKINVTAFLTWFIENYPASEGVMRADPDYQLRFR
jgi:uncharacterized protein